MTQQELIIYLKDSCGCIVVRMDNMGYAVMRNVINAKICGVPFPQSSTGHLRAATICRICRTLCADIPEEAQKAAAVIDHINKNFPGSND